MNGTKVDYKEIIRPFLSEKRYQHSLAVAEEAVRLANENDVNEEKAYTAGILHDIMKEVPQKEMMKKIVQYDIVLTDVERRAPKLWHAILGAAYVERELHLDDQAILSAIRYHTTGRANMPLLEKVLFIADFISKDRDYEGVEEMRAAAHHGLIEAMMRGTAFTIEDLAKRRLVIHPDTVAAYNQAVLDYTKTE